MAASDFGFKVTGFRELERAILALPKALGYSVRYRALEKAAKPMVRAGKDRVRRRSGRTKRSIRARRMARRTYGAEIAVGPTGRAAHLIEFGTEERVVKKTGRKVGRVKPTPFWRPAWDATKDNLVPDLAKSLGDELAKVADRLQKQIRRRR